MSQRAPMRCADADPYLSPFVDDELAEPLREQVAAHLATCTACTRKVERYRETKRLLGSLPSTAPSPDLFDRIMAAIPERYPEPAARESLNGEAREFSLRRKLSALEQPSLDEARVTWFSNRRTLVTRLLPLVAAILLITLGSLTFARFSFMFGRPVATASTPAVGRAAEATQEKVAKLHTLLGFTPVLPKVFPSDAALLDASAGSSNLGAYLDVTWGLPNLAFQVHMRETQGGAVPGYTLAQANPDLSWQLIGDQPWRPMVRSGVENNTAIGQISSGLSIAMDVNVSPSADQYQSALSVLRLLSLSTESAYRAIPIQSMSGSQLQQMVLHYTLIGRDVNNHILWHADGYIDRGSNNQRIDVTANGVLQYTDIISQDSVLRLDHLRGTYQRTSLAALGLTDWANGPIDAQRLFRVAGSYADNQELWNAASGTMTYQGQTVNDLQMVDAPLPTHFYISTSSQQVVAIVVDAQSSMQPGGPQAKNPFEPPFACASYTLLTYVESGQVPGTGFSNQIPYGYSSGNVQQTATC